MPIPGLPPTATQQVKPHILKTTGYVLAKSGDCLAIMKREAAFDPKLRTFRGVTVENLSKTVFKDSWFLGVLLCPGDTTDTVAGWAQTRPARDLDRIRFYFRAGADLILAMKAWVGAKLPDPLFDEGITAWEQFHQLYGGHHATQCFHDFVARPATGIA